VPFSFTGGKAIKHYLFRYCRPFSAKVGNDATSPFLSWLGPGRIGVRVGAGQTLVSEAAGLDGGTFWVQSRSTLTAKAGTKVTINDTAPAYGTWNLALVEIT